MARQDLKSILAQMESFNIPGFREMIEDLKDPALAPNASERAKAIGHNAQLLADRLETMHKMFRVNPDEVADYMTNRQHFTGPEWETMETMRRELSKYTQGMIAEIEGDDSKGETAAVERPQKPAKPKKPKSHSKLQGGRKGWIAS